MNKAILLALTVLAFSGCTTVRYNYNGMQCEKTGQSTVWDRKVVFLTCPYPPAVDTSNLWGSDASSR